MKQSKVPEAPSVPSVPRGPRYRYFSNPPKTIDLRLGDLSDIPTTAFTPFYNADRRVEVPTADILGGPVPKISLARLAELVPDAFQVGIHAGVQLRVPVSRLALSYQLVEGREVIEEPFEEMPAPPPVEETFALLDTLPPPSGEKFAPSLDDLPPPPVDPEETETEKDIAFRPKLPPIAPPAAKVEPVVQEKPMAKEEPVAKEAPKPILPEIAKPAPVVLAPAPTPIEPAPVKPAAPIAAEVAPAPKEPLPEIPAPAAIVPEPPKPEAPEPAPVEAKAEPPAPLIGEGLKPLPKLVPIITPPAPVNPVQEAAPTPPPAAPEPVAEAAEPATPAVPSSPEQVATPAPIARRPFSLLPIFRRKVVETPKPVVPPTPEQPRARVEIPKPKKPLAPLTAINVPPVEPPVAPPKPEIPALAILKEEAHEPKPAAPVIAPEPPLAVPEPQAVPTAKAEPPAPAPIPVPPPAVLQEEEVPAPAPTALVPPLPKKPEAVFVETEHLPQGDKNLPTEIPEQEQDSLQALFHTEDELSVERVVELCNGLPGIQSCILTRSGSVVNARNVPDSIDLISLSANALEMFRALRGSCAKMGIGAVPAVTMHSQKGPITFFQEQDICLLVLHKDRGFVPGVREKLQLVVEQLSKANLLLPVSERGTKELK